MGWRCERCGHEWIPREDGEPAVCPKCKNPYWNRARKSMTTYEDFRDVIEKTLQEAGKPITWTEVRTQAKLQQKFPNNQWVHRLEADIKLKRERDPHGIILWRLE